MYDAEVGLLITEGAFADDGRPRPRGELRAFIIRTIFTTAQLDALISKHDLVTKLRAGSPEGARSRMRKLVEVNTYSDYFEGYRERADPPRSARVTISFSAPDPELALAVARDIGAIVAETQTRRAAEAANLRLEGLRVLAENAAGRAASLEDQLGRAKENALEQPSAVARERLAQLSGGVRVAQDAAKQAAASLVDAQLQAHAVHQLGPMIQVVKQGVPFWRTMPRGERLVRQAMLALFIGCLAALILIGSLDPAVLDEADIQRAGLIPAGRVPHTGV
jgi:hypothetical protein